MLVDSSFADDAVREVELLKREFVTVQGENRAKQSYYDGKERIKDLGISLPPQMRSIETVVGWPGTAVDVLEERLDFEGWSGGLVDDVYASNDLDVEAPQGHLDALIYGTAFVTVGSGMEGEPDDLVTVESPLNMTAVRDNRKRSLRHAAKFWSDDDSRFDLNPENVTLYRPHDTVYLRRDGNNGWRVENVTEHNLGRVPVAQMVNRPRASNDRGRSEITPAVRGYTDAALRTMVGAEVAREFYGVPQRYLMGAPDDFFEDPETGEPRDGWDAVMGKMLGIPSNPDTDELPQVGSFAAHSMSPFFEQIRNYAQMLSAETAIPPMYLGFATDQASSADAIRAMEARLVKRAERRHAMFGKCWTEVARLSVMNRDGVAYEDLQDDVLNIRPMWRDPSTPTKAAMADAATKLGQIGVLPIEGELMMRYLGLSATEREILRQDRRADSSAALRRLLDFNPSNEALEMVRSGAGSNDGVQDATGDSEAD